MIAKTYSTVNWRKYLLEDSSPRIKNFLDSRGNEVFNQVCSVINEAVLHKREKVVILVHPNAGNVILIEKDEFNEVYDIALKWFLKNEQYEMCSTLKNWQDNLKKTKQKQTKNLKSLI